MASKPKPTKSATVIFLHGARYERDPMSAVFEDLPEEELAMLAENIRVEGQKLPITVNSSNGLVLDGWQRLRACERIGIAPLVEEIELSNPAAFVMAINEHRRGSTAPTATMRVLLAEDLLKLDWEAKGRKGRKSSAKKVADAAGCSTGTVEQVRRALRWDSEHGTDYENQMRRGKLSAAAANRQIVAAEYEHMSASGPTSAKKPKPSEQPKPEGLDGASSDEEWKERLREHLLSMSPSGFEQFTATLLKAAGSAEVKVTGRSGDGGIDGIAIQPGIASVKIAFQCKKYQGSVGAPAVRDFRGSFDGQAERGILIATGSFTREAREEAGRPKAQSVDLIDGNELCDLIKSYGLGVRTEVVERVSIDDDFFDQFEASK